MIDKTTFKPAADLIKSKIFINKIQQKSFINLQTDSTAALFLDETDEDREETVEFCFLTSCERPAE